MEIAIKTRKTKPRIMPMWKVKVYFKIAHIILKHKPLTHFTILLCCADATAKTFQNRVPQDVNIMDLIDHTSLELKER